MQNKKRRPGITGTALFVLYYYRMRERLEAARNTIKTVRQESQAYFRDCDRVNDALWYHVSQEQRRELGIHLFKTDIDPSIAGAKIFLNTYKDGLREEITTWSHIVYDYPRLLELLGFTITDERDEKKKEALAVVSREDFLKRYNSK